MYILGVIFSILTGIWFFTIPHLVYVEIKDRVRIDQESAPLKLKVKYLLLVLILSFIPTLNVVLPIGAIVFVFLAAAFTEYSTVFPKTIKYPKIVRVIQKFLNKELFKSK